MQQGNTVFDLKGDARRLRTALAEMKLPVTHTDALNLIARSRGERNWETLEASLTAQAKAAQEAVAATDTAEADRERWLNWLEAALRMQGFSEEDLDELVHEAMADDEAASVNNQGMFEQLSALLTWHDTPAGRYPNPRFNLVDQLAKVHGIKFDMAIPARVSICAGSTLEKATQVDCLEWFANQDIKTIVQLLEDGLENSSMSDEVVLWLEEHTTNDLLRIELKALLHLMRAVCDADKAPTSNVVGLTVQIEGNAVREYLEALGTPDELGIDENLLEALSR
jgi:hypothetical protein